MQVHDTLTAAARGLTQHPQDHGWRDLYGLFAYGLERSAARLQKTLSDSYHARPTSATHLLTLLGIALQFEAPSAFIQLLADDNSYETRLSVLEGTLERHSRAISRILLTRQNSFSCARRYLVTQVFLSAYFGGILPGDLNFADLGTGIGILPKELNSPQAYRGFASDLLWPGGIPEFRKLRLASIYGIDRGPMPDLAWVRACYGRSEYYETLYSELIETMANPEVQRSPVSFHEIDLLDRRALAEFIDEHRINVANLTYVLYELDLPARKKVLQTIIDSLHPPGVLLVTEPSDELRRQGCFVDLYHNKSSKPLALCYVSDGHFKGHVLPLEDYDKFVKKYPIHYRD
jgi:hypothetical protein